MKWNFLNEYILKDGSARSFLTAIYEPKNAQSGALFDDMINGVDKNIDADFIDSV
jgi:hypothetical protein